MIAVTPNIIDVKSVDNRIVSNCDRYVNLFI